MQSFLRASFISIINMESEIDKHTSGWNFFSRFLFMRRRVVPRKFFAILCSLLIVFPIFNVHAQSKTAEVFPKEAPFTGFLQVGEELTYEVSYLSIALGTIKSKVKSIELVHGKPQYKVEVHIRSYDGIPFTTISTMFQSTMTSKLVSTSFSTREWYKDTIHKYINYTFDQKKDVVYVSERYGEKEIRQNYDTLKLDDKDWQDGCSLLFYARGNIFSKKKEHVPTLMYRSKADTYIQFGVERTSMEIDAVDYPVDVFKLEGDANFTGIFGLTGGFRGYFSADSACVPIFAQMKVIVGNVNLELIKWKRTDWKPPRAEKSE